MTINPTSSCCSQMTIASTTTPIISNPSGLPAIRYRIGTFTSFRQAMLDSIALPDLMATSITVLMQPVGAMDTTIDVLDYSNFPTAPNFQIKIGSEYLQVIDGAGTSTWKVVRGFAAAAYSTGDTVTLSPPNPFASWQAGTANDYQTMFVELWAYLADILTFYQERIANEAYLGTAVLRDSLLRLVSLIDYHPGPGAGAGGLVAFTAAKGASLTVPANFRIGSKPASGQSSIVFETSSAVTVSGDNSSIPLSSISPDVPFPQNAIVLQGINNGVAVDDFVLAVENQGTPNEAIHLLQIASANVDKVANVTTITWIQELGDGSYTQASKQVSLYALRLKAAPFGVNAPAWNTLSPTLTNFNGSPNASFPSAPYQNDWDTPTTQSAIVNPWFYVPVPNDLNTVLCLDAIYKQLSYTSQNQGWAVLLTGGVFQVFHVVGARPVAKVAYSLSSKVTQLTFAENMSSNVFPIRDTVVLTDSVLLPLQVDLPLPLALSGNELILEGLQIQLQRGQTVVIQGDLFDPITNAATNIQASESCILDGAPVLDTLNNITRTKLKNPLINTYARSSCSVLGNIAEVTQGETVKDEVLGSSNGSAFQAYPLKKKSLTYLPSDDPEGLTAVKSTLTVTVNGVAWNEQSSLGQSAPDARDFTTTLDDTAQTTVVFGDGFNGARPPSGTNNIHARYRKGLGSSGNLPVGSIQQLVDSIPNLKKVTNPMPSSGGSDADSPAQIRTGAPASLRTFGRAVSAPEYAALALNFPGISKAMAIWVVSDPVTNQAIAHPYVQLTVATVDETPIKGTLLASNLRSFLDSHRDPNVLLRLRDFSPVYIELIVAIEIDSHFPQNATLSQVQVALNPGENLDGSFGYFALQNLQFGQPIFLSAIYAIVQSVPGVTNATITSLRRVGPGVAEPSGTVPHDITIGPTEIASIGAAGAGQGQLIITGSGGFIDS
ncbi:MAG TPA: baseplate J/gp47 family protein [Alloacidobacterium sp.]|nr:baseplate J/gp47 family protein [Alloacidobacterium sp.]